MIYNNPLNESNIILRGAEADAYLESCGITLFSDAVAIGEMVMDGITGEKILAENGITLNEDHIVLEGKQAEEYLKNKMKEKDKEYENKIKNDDRINRRINTDSARRDPKFSTAREIEKHRERYGSVMPKTTNAERAYAAAKDKDKEENFVARAVSSNEYRHNGRTYEDQKIINDAIRRQYRRHPEKFEIEESTIFRYSDLISE